MELDQLRKITRAVPETLASKAVLHMMLPMVCREEDLSRRLVD